MAERSAYDILNLLGSAQRENTQLVGGLIDSGFRNATAGIRTAADIMSQTVQSGIDYKKTVVDEWYKAENLKQNDRQIDATIQYHNASLVQRDRQIDAEIQRADMINKREIERTEKADKNKLATTVLTQKRLIYDSSIRGISTMMRTIESTLQSRQKMLSEQGHRWPASHVAKVQAEIGELQNKLIGGIAQLENLTTDAGNLEGMLSGLMNGDLDADIAIKELNALSPEVINASPESRPLGVSTVVGPNGVPVPAGVHSTPGSGVLMAPNTPGYGPETGLTIDDPTGGDVPFTPVDEDAERHSIGMAQTMISNLYEKGGVAALPEINNYINGRVNSEAKKFFDDKQKALEEQFLTNKLRKIIAPAAGDNDFALPANFQDEYLKAGGNPNKLNDISQRVMFKHDDIYNTQDPNERNKKIQELHAEIFPADAKKGINTNGANQEQPARVIREDGSINVPSEFSDPHPLGAAFEVELSENNKKQKAAITKVIGGFDEKGNRVEGEALTKKDGKTVLSEKGIKALASMSIERMDELGLIDLNKLNNIDGLSIMAQSAMPDTPKGKRIIKDNPRVVEFLNKKKKEVIQNLIRPENKVKAVNILIKLAQ
jgi:hypothetical protein